MTEFTLDPSLDRDTHFIGELDLCRVLLMDDARWPWLILVPRRDGVRELFELSGSDQTLLMRECAQVSAVFMKLVGGEKLNLAALGNVVPQLHVHLVARKASDHAWPKPVWGLFPRQQYDPAVVRELVPKIAAALGLPEPD